MFSPREIISHKLSQCIEEVFERIGLDLDDYGMSKVQIRGVSPCHEGADNPTSFAYYFDNGLWQCFSNNCHQQYGSDTLGLIMAVKKCSYQEAVNLAEKILSGKKVNSTIPTRRIVKAFIKNDNIDEHLRQHVYSNDTLQRLSNPFAYTKFRGLDYNVVRAMGGGIARQASNGWYNRLVFPVKNVVGGIVGFTGRKTDDCWGPKWIHGPKDRFRKDLNLFNIDRATSHIELASSVILVEGPIDVIKLEMAGYKNVVATLGTSISEDQIKLLTATYAVAVFLGYDNDEAGQTATMRVQRKLEAGLFDQYILQYRGTKKDWGECSIEEIESIMSANGLGGKHVE